MIKKTLIQANMEKFRNHYRLLMQLAFILAFAMSLRLLFFSGPIFQESYATLEGSYNLATQSLEKAQSGNLFASLNVLVEPGLRKVISYAPISFFYLIGGVSNYTSIGFALLSSISSLTLLFFLVFIWHGKNAALISVFLWSIIPSELILATIPRLNTALLPLILGGLLLVTLGWNRQKIYLTGLGLLVSVPVLALDILLGLYLLVVLLSYILWHRNYKKIVWLGLLVLGIGLFINYGFVALMASYRLALEVPGGIQLLVLLIAALAAKSILHYETNSYHLVWLCLTFLALTIRNYSLATFELSYELEILIWGISMIAIANYLAARKKAESLNNLLVFSLPIILIIIVLIDRGQTVLIPNYSDLANPGPGLVLALEVFAGITMFIALLSPLFHSHASRTRVGISFILLMTFSLSLLPGIWTRKEAQTYGLNEVFEIVDLVKNQYIDLPTYVNDSQLFDLLNYASAFAEEEQAFLFEKKTQIDNGFVVFREGSLADIPSNWVQIDVVGRLRQPRWVIYRALQPDIAQMEWETAMLSSQDNPTRDKLIRLYRAYISVGKHCEAYNVWRQGQVESFEYILIEPETECFTHASNRNFLSDLPRSNRGNSFSEPGVVYTHLTRVSPLNDGDGVLIFHLHPFYPDPRVFDLEFLLEPNSFYLYEATIRSTPQVSALYWAADGGEFVALTDDFPSSRKITVLIATPNWPEPGLVKFSPVLFDHLDFVDLKDVRLIELNELNDSLDLQ